MNEHDRPEADDIEGASDDGVASLLRLAGPRAVPPTERTARVRAAVHAEWRRATRRRRFGPWVWAGAAAAGLLLSVAGWRLSPQRVQVASPVPVAVVEKLDGPARGLRVVREGMAGPVAPEIGDRLPAGTVLETTGTARLAVELKNGVLLRLDHGTRIVLVSGSVIALDQGAIYADSGPGSAGQMLEVRTTRGVVRDQGTQFEVRASPDAVRVRVREGSVRLQAGGARYDAGPGGEIRAKEAGVTQGTIPLHGPDWDWMLALAPSFPAEGATLPAFLAWACRENGWTYRFSDARAAAAGRGVILHGSIEGLNPAEAVEAILPTTGFVHRLSGATLLLSPDSPPR